MQENRTLQQNVHIITKCHKVRFKINTGADVTVISSQTYGTIADKNIYLAKADRLLPRWYSTVNYRCIHRVVMQRTDED